MSNNYFLYELLNKNKENLISFGGEVDVNAIVKLLKENNFCQLPFKVGDTVFKLFDKNKPENQDTENIINSVEDLATVPTMAFMPVEVTDSNYLLVLNQWNVLFFATEEEASDGKQDFYIALEGKTAEERYENYVKWLDNRKLKMSKITRLSTPDEDFESYLSMSYSNICYAFDCDDSFQQEFEIALQCNALNGLLDTLVYKHLSTGRYLCLTNRGPYNVTGKVCEVVLFQSFDLSDYKNDAPHFLCELIESLTSMLFVHYYCGGIIETDGKKEAIWFREKIVGGEQNG